MRLALEWVQENIHSFNGDAKSVTLMGTSAGSGAVHLLALSNKTEGLFSKYILLSGSALGPWNVHASKLYRRTCLEVARSLGCLPNEMIVMNKADNSKELENNRTGNIYDYIFSMNDNNTLEDDEEMMRCMRSADIDSILNTIPHLVSVNYKLHKIVDIMIKLLISFTTVCLERQSNVSLWSRNRGRFNRGNCDDESNGSNKKGLVPRYSSNDASSKG